MTPIHHTSLDRVNGIAAASGDCSREISAGNPGIFPERLTLRRRLPFWSWIVTALAMAVWQGVTASYAPAATFTWKTNASGPAWSAASNWGGTLPGAADIAKFSGAAYAFQPSLTTTASVGGIWSTGSASLTISGSELALYGTTINSKSGTGIEVDAGAGALNINAPLDLQNNQQWINNSVNSITVNGNVSGSGDLVKAGSGTLALAGSNIYAGGTVISGGLLQLGNNAALGSPSAPLSVNGGTLDLHGYGGSSGVNVGALSGGGLIDNLFGSSPYLVVGNGNASSTFSGTIQNTVGTLEVDKTGTGTLALSGSSSFSILSVLQGTVLLNNANALSGVPFTSINVDSGLQFAPGIGSFTVGGLGGWNLLKLNDTANNPITLTIGPAAGNAIYWYGGPITGSGNLVVNSPAATLDLQGSNTFTGTTTVNQGVLRLGNVNAVQDSNLVVNVDYGVQFDAGIGTLNLGGLAGNNAVNLTDVTGGPVTLVVGGNGSSTTYGGALGGSGSLTKAGSGTLTLGAPTATRVRRSSQAARCCWPTPPLSPSAHSIPAAAGRSASER